MSTSELLHFKTMTPEQDSRPLKIEHGLIQIRSKFSCIKIGGVALTIQQHSCADGWMFFRQQSRMR